MLLGGSVEFFHRLQVQPERGRAEVLLQVRDARRAGDRQHHRRPLQQPRQRDGGHAGPYAYVGPWTKREGPFWNADFGSVCDADQLPDAEAVAAYFGAGRQAAAT